MDTGVGRQKGEAVKNIADIDPLELARRRPEWSAAQPITRQQKRAIVAIVLVIVVALIFAPLRTAQILIGFCTLFYVISTLYKFAVIRASLSPSAIMRFSLRRSRASSRASGRSTRFWCRCTRNRKPSSRC